MTAQPSTPKGSDPRPIFDMALSFMRSKHLFAASELGIFEALADGAKSLSELARHLNLPSRTARIIVDAVTALGFLEREGESYSNSEVAQIYLSGRGPQDMRPGMHFFNCLSYRRWLTLEDSVRLGRGASGEFNFTPEEQEIFSEGVAALTAGQAAALSESYDFGHHSRLLDLGGGTGSFLAEISQRYPTLQSTLFEFPAAASVAREKLRGTSFMNRVNIVEGNFLIDPLPTGHDVFLVANVVHALKPEDNQALFHRARKVANPKARVLLLDLWTNAVHTEPLFAALMAGEFLVVGGSGDVYSVDEGRTSLEQAGWHFVEHRPLAGPASLLVVEA